MDAGHILVAVLTSAAVAWLVWVEVHSRRNAAAQNVQESPEEPELQANEDRVIIAATRTRLRDKASARTT